MYKTSPRSGAGTAGVKLHKNDDARLAANTESKDFGPLIRILNAAIPKTESNDRSRVVLYLKHDAKHADPFITTDYKDPRQRLSDMKGDQGIAQYVAAATLVCERADYWMAKLPDQPDVIKRARAVIDHCSCSDSALNQDGTYATTLRHLLQELNDALNPPSPSTDAESPGQDPSKEKEEKKKKGKSSWFSLRSHKHPPVNTAPQAGSQPTSPRSPLTTASNSLNVSPRAPDPDLSFAIPPPSTLAGPPTNSGPPLRPLPPLPSGATGPRPPGTNTVAHEPQATAPATETDTETLRFS